MTLGQKLKDARLKRGLTLQQVATALGYKYRAVVHNWESGYRIPKLVNLKRLAKLYEVDVMYFVVDD